MWEKAHAFTSVYPPASGGLRDRKEIVVPQYRSIMGKRYGVTPERVSLPANRQNSHGAASHYEQDKERIAYSKRAR